MNKHGFKIIESKKDRENVLKKNFPALGLFYVKLEKLLPKGVFKQVYIVDNTICIFDYDYRLNIKYENRQYVIFSNKMEPKYDLYNIDHAMFEFLKIVIHVLGGCQGFNFDISTLPHETMIPRLKEKWYYKTLGAIKLNDYLYNIVNHFDINDWKEYLDLTKKSCIEVIEYLIMHKIYQEEPIIQGVRK